VLLLFYAYGVLDLEEIYRLIRRTARWADQDTMRRLLYATQQHTSNVRDHGEALAVLTRYTQLHPVVGGGRGGGPAAGSNAATEDLLNANVLPHLAWSRAKLEYLAHLIGLLLNPGNNWKSRNITPHPFVAWLNHLFLSEARISQLYDKDHMGNKRIDVCGPLLCQQVRNALFRMRGYVERGLAKGMTCRSQVALAVRELAGNPGRSMATIQAAIIAYYESHMITRPRPGLSRLVGRGVSRIHVLLYEYWVW
jgi:DNA-directed RNA polymerase beta subunit